MLECSRSLFPILQEHRTKWSGCTACSLSTSRIHSVFYRGSIPADLLFVGDYPAEDTLVRGVPFDGDLAPLLNSYVPRDIKFAVTYLVACNGGSPSVPETKACWGRLTEFIKLVNPCVICTIGKAADSWFLRNLHEIISQLNRPPIYTRANSPIFVRQAKDQILELKKCKHKVQEGFRLWHEEEAKRKAKKH